MELNEVVNRIVRRHIALFVALLLAGVLGALFLHWHDRPLYPATARFVLDTQDPQTQSESQAIATGPSQVAMALDRIGVHRDVLDVAKDDVTVQALGSSGVLELTASDQDPKVAAALANALANRVIAVRSATTTGRVDRILRSLSGQINALTKQIVDTDSKLDALDLQIAGTTDPQSLVTLRAQRDGLSQTRDYLAQRRVVLESERATIATSDAVRPQATVLDPAEPPIAAQPDRRLLDVMLGGLLGLLLAAGIAGAIETFRPSLVGTEAIARRAGAPVLIQLSGPPGEVGVEEVMGLATHLDIAAHRAQVDQVEFMGTDRSTDLFLLALLLGRHPAWRVPAVGGEKGTNGEGGTPRSSPLSHTVSASLADSTFSNGSKKVGLVLVAPTSVSLTDLSAALNFRSLSGWPLLGIVTYPKRRAWVPFHRELHSAEMRAASGNGGDQELEGQLH
jgi:capsular polysaccharide biosynthesis protein